MLRRSIRFTAVGPPAVRPALSRARFLLTWTLLILALLSMAVLWWVDRQLSRPLRSWAELQVRNIGQRAITEAIQEVLAAEAELAGEAFVRQLPAGPDGTAAWQYDWARLHRLDAAITERVLERMNGLREERIPVPLGELLGVDILAGTGPAVPVRILPAGSVATDLEFVFTSVGINQVLHEIAVVIDLHMRVIAPMVSDDVHVSHRIPLSTIVLQGQVPQVFVEWQSGTLSEFIAGGLANRAASGT